jgi:hypothetical protein
MREYLLDGNRASLTKRVGDFSQLAGAKRYVLTDGKALGVEAVDIKTGSGLCFTVLPGRGMDIAWAEYRGVPLAYLSKTGIVGPSYYESDGMNWLRNFFAGLLTTCGLSNVGGPGVETDPVIGEVAFGLHGRISNMAAGDVCVGSRWVDGEYVMSVSGQMRESRLHGENLLLRRTVVSKLGSNRLEIHDEIENEGMKPQPLMLLYHFNIGYPLLADATRLVCQSATVTAAAGTKPGDIPEHASMGPPVNGAGERLFFHDITPDSDGSCRIVVVNPELELGLLLEYRKDQLPFFSEWKQLAEAEYVLGLEPGNCLPVGRKGMDGHGGMEILAAGASKSVDIAIEILDGARIARYLA